MFLASIRIDGGTQPRSGLDEAVVADYAEALKDGAEFPPVDVFHDGTDFWLADGFHRYFAFKKAKQDSIPATVRDGTKRDAVLFAVSANSAHGLRRSNEDKRKAVSTLLADPEWGQWSDRKIASVCRVGRSLVAEVRASLAEKPVTDRTYTTKHGTTATMDTAGQAEANKKRKEEGGKKEGKKEGKKKKTEPEPPPRDELEDAVQTLTEANRELTAEVETLRASSNGDAEKTIRELKAYILTVESQRDEWMNKCGQLTKEVKRLQRKLGVPA